MDYQEFIELDSDKGQWLLDNASFRQWQRDMHRDAPPHKKQKITPDNQQYQEMRNRVSLLYDQIVQAGQDAPDGVRERLFYYLSGESMDEIAKSGNPPITRQGVQKSLRKVLKNIDMKQARQIWWFCQQYGS